MIHAHLLALVGLMVSRNQRLRSLSVIVGGGYMISLCLDFSVHDWGIQVLLLFLTAVLLVQWRSTLFHPASEQLELPIPLRRTTVEWLISGLQVVSVCALAFGLSIVTWFHGHPVSTLGAAAFQAFVQSLIAICILIPITVLCGRWMRGMGAQREILVWSAGPALAAISVVGISLQLPLPMVYAVWLCMAVAIVLTVVLLISRLLIALSGKRKGQALCRAGLRPDERLVRDCRAGIVRAVGSIAVIDACVLAVVLWGCSSSIFYGHADKAPLFIHAAMACMFGARILALTSFFGQTGLSGGMLAWPSKPWGLLPVDRTTIQRALLKHITAVAVAASAMTFVFRRVWWNTTRGEMWVPDFDNHIAIQETINIWTGFISGVTVIMAIVFMVVSTGMRNAAHLFFAGATVMVLIYLWMIGAPDFLPMHTRAVVRELLLMVAIWGLSTHIASRRQSGRFASQGA